MTITETPLNAATDTPVSRSPSAVSDAPENASEAPPDVPPTQKRNLIKASRTTTERLMLALCLTAAVGGTVVGVIGFAMSYSTLARVALTWGFSTDLAPWFPVGVDASIVAFLALDLYLIRQDTPWPPLRLAAHGMTGATIWFNASSQGHIGSDPVQAVSHGVMPLLFVIGVEAARRLFIKKAQLEKGTHTDRIPLHRWILSPFATPKFYRRMRLHGITSYPEMIQRQQDHDAYEMWLKRKYGQDLAEASEDELLPLKMAAYGYTVAEALAMPEQQEREAAQREQEAERRRLQAETQRIQEQAQFERDRLEAEGELEVTRERVNSETEQARAHARAQVNAAEKAAELEETAQETAAVAEARAREAEAERKEAAERAAQAAADAEAAELEQQAAQKRKEAAEADALAAAEAQAIETAEIAEANKRAAEADRVAAETEQAAAETRRAAAEADRKAAEDRAAEEAASAVAEQEKNAAAETRQAAAELEARAVEMEDAARLSPRQRAVHRVARLILTRADGDPSGLSLAEIQSEMGVSAPTASEYRSEAAELLTDGYATKLHGATELLALS